MQRDLKTQKRLYVIAWGLLPIMVLTSCTAPGITVKAKTVIIQTTAAGLSGSTTITADAESDIEISDGNSAKVTVSCGGGKSKGFLENGFNLAVESLGLIEVISDF